MNRDIVQCLSFNVHQSEILELFRGVRFKSRDQITGKTSDGMARVRDRRGRIQTGNELSIIPVVGEYNHKRTLKPHRERAGEYVMTPT